MMERFDRVVVHLNSGDYWGEVVEVNPPRAKGGVMVKLDCHPELTEIYVGLNRIEKEKIEYGRKTRIIV